MASSPALSVVIPTKNRAAILQADLEALRAQIQMNHDRFEVLVADDGSTDHTPEILAQPRFPFSLRSRDSRAADPLEPGAKESRFVTSHLRRHS